MNQITKAKGKIKHADKLLFLLVTLGSFSKGCTNAILKEKAMEKMERSMYYICYRELKSLGYINSQRGHLSISTLGIQVGIPILKRMVVEGKDISEEEKEKAIQTSWVTKAKPTKPAIVHCNIKSKNGDSVSGMASHTFSIGAECSNRKLHLATQKIQTYSVEVMKELGIRGKGEGTYGYNIP